MALAKENHKKECKMRKIVFVIIFCFIISYCKAQIDTINKNIVEYFDKNKYKNWELVEKISSATDKYYKKETYWVRVLFYKGEYTEEIQTIGSSFKLYKYYHKNELLHRSVKTFYNFPIGESIEYDENGNLIEKVNYDKNYSFSVDSLCELIKMEYGVNLRILSTDNFLNYRVERRYDDNIKKYLYIVIFAVNDNGERVMGFPIKCIYIDSNTGEILYEKAEHLDRPYSDRIPKSKTFFPQKDDKKRIEVSK